MRTHDSLEFLPEHLPGYRRKSVDDFQIEDVHAANKPVVCVITSREAAYSETFIRDHIKRLPAEVKVLYGGRSNRTRAKFVTATAIQWLDSLVFGGAFPNRTADGRRLVSLLGRGADLMMRHVFCIRVVQLSELGLRRYLCRERVDAVLAEYGWTGVEVMRTCASANIPLIVHFHGADAYKRKWIEKHRSSYREMFAIASAMIAVSKDMVKQLGVLGAPQEKVFYNPCGVDVSLFDGADPAASPPTFLAVGQFVEKKAPHLTLSAFKKVLECEPQARLVMIGGGELLERCQQLTRALGMERAVTYEGVRSHQEVGAAMRKARAFVQHSVQASSGDCEGTPLSVLEASASGLPVISTDHGGIRDVVKDGETGYLVAEGDTDGMSRHMINLIRSPDLAAALGQTARAHVRANFSMEKSIATLTDIIEHSRHKQRNRLTVSKEGHL